MCHVMPGECYTTVDMQNYVTLECVIRNKWLCISEISPNLYIGDILLEMCRDIYILLDHYNYHAT